MGHTSIIALLACMLAVLGLSGELRRQTRSCALSRPSLSPLDEVWSSEGRGIGQSATQVKFTLCGDQQNQCAEQGHPVWSHLSFLFTLAFHLT